MERVKYYPVAAGFFYLGKPPLFGVESGFILNKKNKKMVSRTYDVLKFLYDHNGRIDVDVLMTELTNEVPEAEKFDAKQRLVGTITEMMHRDNGFLREWHFSTKSDFSIKYINRSPRRLYDDELIPLEISDKGIAEYHKLTKLYFPEPPEPHIVNSGSLIYAPGNKGQIAQVLDSSDSPIIQSVTTTPNTNESIATKIAWYSKPLFKYIIWPLVVLIIFGLITYAISTINKPPSPH